MSSSAQTILDAKLFDQVWSSADLNPDRLTNEIYKIFTYNQTQRNNFSDLYFDYNKNQITSSSTSRSAVISIPRFGISTSGSLSSSSSSSLLRLTHDVVLATQIQNLLGQEAVEMQWTGEKLIPKFFQFYKLTDSTDRLQVAIIAKQLTADKINGDIIRTVNTFNDVVEIMPTIHPPTILTGESRPYTGEKAPELPWLICDGGIVSCIEYQRLSAVIDTRYEAGNGLTTFNLPDFRGRAPLGQSGGETTHTPTVEQLLAHKNSKGTLGLATSGNHTHAHTDSSHNHGGLTGSDPLGGTGRGMTTAVGADDQLTHTHVIPTDLSHITIHDAGVHTHELNGEMNSVTSDQEFSLINPYQVVQYIIYTGD